MRSPRKPHSHYLTCEQDLVSFMIRQTLNFLKINLIPQTIFCSQPPEDAEAAYDDVTAAMAATGRVPRNRVNSPGPSNKQWRAFGQAMPLLNQGNINHDDAKMLAEATGISQVQAMAFVIEKRQEGLEIDKIIEIYLSKRT
mmetsp:Transcript_7019/g.12600  ORF Transcript_7019/g.12600 Transcript_7019/m.12600 type:complete len:141 (-) Transcript_7019:59-481(-)